MPDDVIQAVSNECAYQLETIMQKGIKGEKGEYRSERCDFLLRQMAGETDVALRRHFGGITGSGIAIKHRQIANQIEADVKLKGWVNSIRKKIFDI